MDFSTGIYFVCILSFSFPWASDPDLHLCCLSQCLHSITLQFAKRLHQGCHTFSSMAFTHSNQQLLLPLPAQQPYRPAPPNAVLSIWITTYAMRSRIIFLPPIMSCFIWLFRPEPKPHAFLFITRTFSSQFDVFGINAILNNLSAIDCARIRM